MASVDMPSSSRSGAEDECAPEARIPAWWSGFLFHVLNPRQVSMYLYLIMLSDDDGACHPTIDQIRRDLGLLSATMVFESIAVLEELGFFVRSRQSLEGRSKQNVYQRTACEYTVLRLLELGKIDSRLRAAGSPVAPASEEAKQLTQEGLRKLLEDDYDRYEAMPEQQQHGLVVNRLNKTLAERSRGIYL